MIKPVRDWIDMVRDGLQDGEYALVGLILMISPFVLPFYVGAWFVGAAAAWVLLDNEECGEGEQG